MTDTMHKLVTLGPNPDVQYRLGYPFAKLSACAIAKARKADVVVIDGEGRTIVWCPDGTHRPAATDDLELVLEVTPTCAIG